MVDRVAVSRRLGLAEVALVMASLALACTDSSGPAGTVTKLPNSPFLVSSPVPDPSPSSSSGVGAQSGVVVYVSLPPGAIPTGFSATIRDLRSGSSVTAAVVNGGFDPVALPAIVGDTLAIVVQAAGSTGPSFLSVVAGGKRPGVVRTDPPTYKTDVPLNGIIVVVFSEPIDPATLTGSTVQLKQGTTLVPGQLAFADVAHLRATFTPDLLLAGGIDYVLTVTQGVMSVTGQPLDAAITVPFTTGTIAPATNLVFASVSAGETHSCGVTTSGAAYCWGNNSFGQLGNGTTASHRTPVAVAGGLSFSVLSAGNVSTCGVTTTGAVYCWGVNEQQLIEPYPTPVAVPGGPTFVAISATGGFGGGGDFACGVTTTDVVYCWGANVVGAFSIRGTGRVAVSAGGAHACAITPTGAAYCSGNNILGQIGDGTYSNNRGATQVSGGLAFAAISARNQSSCGITTAGALYCWGWLRVATTTPPELCYEPLDESTTPCSTVPAAVAGGITFASVSLGFPFSCGLALTGAAYCWGSGNLGDGTSVGSLTPVAVTGTLSFAEVSAGADGSACGVTTGGEAYCWGNNSYGQLGDGTTTNRLVPVKVAGQP